MRVFAPVLFILVLASAAFAVNYTAEYAAGNWLKVTRNIEVMDDPCFAGGVSNVCMNSGAVHPSGTQSGYSTKVTLSVQNTGAIPRNGISIGESVAYVPVGVQLSFDPKPTTNDGRQVFWAVGNLSAGESRSVSYVFPAVMREGSANRIPAVSILSEPVLVSLSAPNESKVGDRLTITLKTASGRPVPNATIYVEYSDGSRQPVQTGKDGVAAFTASRPGNYTYSIDGYRLSGPVSTNAKPADEAIPVLAAAVVGDKGIFQSIAGIFPVLAAIFVIAVVALMVYNFLTSRKDEGEEPGAAGAVPPAQQASAAPVYTQRFTFAQEAQQENSIREATRDILESRKRQLKEAEPKEELHEQEEGIGGAESFLELDQQVADLEAKARAEGESAREEADIEKTIAELESIREKLRFRKLATGASGESTVVQGEAGSGGIGEEATAEDEGQAAPGKSFSRPQPRKPPYGKKSAMAPKAKKMKYASHGIRKK